MGNGAVSRVRLGARGAISGALAWGMILAVRKLGVQNDTIFQVLQFSVAAVAPGLIFGLFLGTYLDAMGA